MMSAAAATSAVGFWVDGREGEVVLGERGDSGPGSEYWCTSDPAQLRTLAQQAVRAAQWLEERQ